MDKDGQLTFSDDPILNRLNDAYQCIEKGEFNNALKMIGELMDINPDYPGLIEGYRTIKFWNNRESILKGLEKGRKTAEYLMQEWDEFNDYAYSKEMTSSAAYKSAMRYIFFSAADHYRFAFKEQQGPLNNYSFLLKLGDCFLQLEEYHLAVDVLEYAKNSYQSNARLLAILGESYFHIDDIPKSLLYFREAFFVDPSEIDLSLLKAKPISDLVEIIKKESGESNNYKEWIPVYGYLVDIFYVKRNLAMQQVEEIKKDVYNLEVSYKNMSRSQLKNSNIEPRLINKYLWLLDYYELQNYSFDYITQIRERLIKINPELFKKAFKKGG